MPMDTPKAHAKLLYSLLKNMDEVFTAALDHPKITEPDRNVAAEMLVWIRDGRFLCKQIEATRSDYDPPSDHPLLQSLYTLDQQVTEINKELRKLHLTAAGAPDRLRALLDGQP